MVELLGPNLVDEIEAHNAEAPPIDLPPVPTADDLRCNVLRRSCFALRHGHRGEFRFAKIANEKLPFAAGIVMQKHDIAGFYVSVHDPILVGVGNASGDLLENAARCLRSERYVGVDKQVLKGAIAQGIQDVLWHIWNFVRVTLVLHESDTNDWKNRRMRRQATDQVDLVVACAGQRDDPCRGVRRIVVIKGKHHLRGDGSVEDAGAQHLRCGPVPEYTVGFQLQVPR
jgi:hypothetical protein